MRLELTTFRSDITPPLGHPLCASWYAAAESVEDPLSANGIVLFPESQPPIVLCALDWAELSNSEYDHWRERIATAADTSPHRVAIHCIHCHDAPWPDRDAQEILDRAGHPRLIMWREWVEQALDGVCHAIQASLEERKAVVEIRAGSAAVTQVASNRRIMGPDGKVRAVRRIQCEDASLHAEPEGLIDPFLKSISFHGSEHTLAVLHFYAVHPSCIHNTGRVSCEFAGIARNRLTDLQGIPHIYFTECAGNITIGKYYRPDRLMREVFTNRILHSMKAATEAAKPVPMDFVRWETSSVLLPANDRESRESLIRTISDNGASDATRTRAALILAYHQRVEAGLPIQVSALHLGPNVALVSLPGESFIEFQLFAQSLRPDAMVIVPAYADCGPGYVMPDHCHAEGGYEPLDSFCGPGSESPLKSAIQNVLLPHQTIQP